MNSGVGITCKIAPGRQSEQMLLLDERARFGQVLARIVHVRFAGGVPLGDLVQHLAHHLVDALIAGQFGWSLCPGAIFRCSGRASSSMRSRTTSRSWDADSSRESGVSPGRHGVAELAVVQFRAQPPVGLPCHQTVFEKVLEFAHGRQSGAGGALIGIL